MKKRVVITLGVLGCALLVGGGVLSMYAFSRPNGKNLDLSVYTAYVEYRNNGGMKTYTEWVKDGSVSKPKEHDKMVYEKGEKGVDVVSAEIDKDGNLILHLSNGKTIKPLFQKRSNILSISILMTCFWEKSKSCMGISLKYRNLILNMMIIGILIRNSRNTGTSLLMSRNA